MTKIQSASGGSNVLNIDGLGKSPRIVMPDLIRHPEHNEFAG
jgi:hypothetical protein